MSCPHLLPDDFMLKEKPSLVSDIQTTSSGEATHSATGPSKEDVYDELVSDLLETTADTNANTGNINFGFLSQVWPQYLRPTEDYV